MISCGTFHLRLGLRRLGGAVLTGALGGGVAGYVAFHVPKPDGQLLTPLSSLCIVGAFAIGWDKA